MAQYDGKTVEEILRFKRASIKNAALDEGSPSWDEILDMNWEELEQKAKQGETGYRTILKLLKRRRFDK